jgi:hypothetical protein
MVGLAGDGKPRDGSEASKEFREFLTNVPSFLLSRYANECLGEEKFSESSSALQDVINEVGRRLGFKVENGLYRGKVNEIGNDGLWHSDSDAAIILEVKTTATYAIDLDTLANYRKKLAAEGKIDLEKSSILIVVGRTEKTDSLEAQVRGSRHAWDNNANDLGYWFGFHRHQKETLESYESGNIAFGCGSADSILLIPVKDFAVWLNDLNTTQGEDRFYWHVHLREVKKKFTLKLKGGKQPVDLTKYLI